MRPPSCSSEFISHPRCWPAVWGVTVFVLPEPQSAVPESQLMGSLCWCWALGDCPSLAVMDGAADDVIATAHLFSKAVPIYPLTGKV